MLSWDYMINAGLSNIAVSFFYENLTTYPISSIDFIISLYEKHLISPGNGLYDCPMHSLI